MKRYYWLLILIAFLLTISGCQRNVVTFVDYDGTIIQEVEVKRQLNIPEDPKREGYTFIGWDCDLDNVESNLVTKALYQVNEYQIKFLDLDDEITVIYGDSVEVLPIMTKEDHKFIGWTYQDELIELPFVYSYAYDLILEPLYKEGSTYKVKFYDDDSKLIHTSIVERGKSAIPPSAPLKIGYEFVAWDRPFNAIRNDLDVKPLYRPLEFYIYFNVTPKISPILVKYDEIVDLPHLTKNAHIFEGWRYGESLFSKQLAFKYLEDIHISPQFRGDDYAEMIQLQSLVSLWIDSAQSFQTDLIIKIKERESDKNYLINLNEVLRAYPEHNYIETKLYIDGKLNAYNVTCMELSSLYLYTITPRIGQTSIYTKEKLDDPLEIEDYKDYENITQDLSKRLICEKIGHNNFIIITKLENEDFFKEQVELNPQLKKYKDELVYTLYYFDEVNNLFYIKMNTKLEFSLEYEIFISEYNQIERIDFQSGDYEQTGTSKNPEVISDINKLTVKTQGTIGGYSHYYLADFEEGFYLFDLEKHIDDNNKPTYSLKVSADFEDLSYPYSQVLNEITINQKKIFYVKGGTYNIRLSGTHRYGYSFRFQKLDYLSFETFNNKQQLTDKISGEFDGIFDSKVYELNVQDSFKILTISNITDPIKIVRIKEDGRYEESESRFGDSVFRFEVTRGKNTIIIIATEATLLDLNITLTDD